MSPTVVLVGSEEDFWRDPEELGKTSAFRLTLAYTLSRFKFSQGGVVAQKVYAGNHLECRSPQGVPAVHSFKLKEQAGPHCAILSSWVMSRAFFRTHIPRLWPLTVRTITYPCCLDLQVDFAIHFRFVPFFGNVLHRPQSAYAGLATNANPKMPLFPFTSRNPGRCWDKTSG